MKKAIYYLTASGAIRRTMSMLPDDEEYPDPQAGESVTISADPNVDIRLNRIDPATGDVIARTAMSLVFTPSSKEVDADGVAEIVITGIPAGTVVRASLPEGDITQVIDDGQVEISSDTPGIGRLDFVSNVYLSQLDVTVEFI